MQDDHHNPMLTVKETLIFAAMLRKRTSKKDEIMTFVDDTIEILGLKKIENDFVKTPEKRTMSNGQLRRLSIGVEVVCAPPLIFLDEPTSGLDSYLALSVVNSLKSLAKVVVVLYYAFMIPVLYITLVHYRLAIQYYAPFINRAK